MLMASTGGACIRSVHNSLSCTSLLQVLLGDNCHIYNYEGGGISALGGLAFHVLHNEPNGEILLENLQAAIRYRKMRLSQNLCAHGCFAVAIPHAAASCCSMSDNTNPPHLRPRLALENPISGSALCAHCNPLTILFVCLLLLTLLHKCRPDDAHCSRTGLVCLESSHNRCGGTVLSLEYMATVKNWADSLGIPVHLDGARVFNAAEALGVSVGSIAAHVTTIQFCLSKVCILIPTLACLWAVVCAELRCVYSPPDIVVCAGIYMHACTNDVIKLGIAHVQSNYFPYMQSCTGKDVMQTNSITGLISSITRCLTCMCAVT
jgi:hypothetical protein